MEDTADTGPHGVNGGPLDGSYMDGSAPQRRRAANRAKGRSATPSTATRATALAPPLGSSPPGRTAPTGIPFPSATPRTTTPPRSPHRTRHPGHRRDPPRPPALPALGLQRRRLPAPLLTPSLPTCLRLAGPTATPPSQRTLAPAEALAGETGARAGEAPAPAPASPPPQAVTAFGGGVPTGDAIPSARPRVPLRLGHGRRGRSCDGTLRTRRRRSLTVRCRLAETEAMAAMTSGDFNGSYTLRTDAKH